MPAGALMSEAKFEGANMREVVLSKAYAVGASLKGADLTNAVVDRVDFDGADLSGARFVNAVITGGCGVCGGGRGGGVGGGLGGGAGWGGAAVAVPVCFVEGRGLARAEQTLWLMKTPTSDPPLPLCPPPLPPPPPDTQARPLRAPTWRARCLRTR